MRMDFSKLYTTACGPGWVETVFTKRECIKFIPSIRDNSRCCCGQLWQFHRDGSPATIRLGDIHWRANRHTQQLATDAYGTIEFQGGAHPTKARYIRLAHDTQPFLLLELLSREWGLGIPKLLITIHGGKTNFDLQPKLKKVIKKGLLKAARTTGAWVFTAGTNSGVTRHVGDALALEGNLRDRSSRVVSVGIAPWGIVERRNELIGRNKDAPYHPINSPRSRFAALNSHHRFFLLVDNGTTGKYGPEIILRRKLENYISQQRMEARGGLVTPVVCVIIEGGPQTIRQVLEYVTDSPPVPVIVCDGTGRAADILAFAHKYALTGQKVLENNRETLVATLERLFELRTDQAEKLFEELQQCVKRKDLITVFRLKEGLELDQSILSALVNSKKLNPPEQLSLALTWNRVDIARSDVFNEDVEWPPGSLEQAMMDALVNDRIEFVKLLLEQGVSMHKFLTIQRLEELYNSTGPTNTLQYIVKDVKKTITRDYRYSLIDIGLVINKLMGGAFRSSYTRKKFKTCYSSVHAVKSKSRFFESSPKCSAVEASNDSPKDIQYSFDYPFSELLVWAVLTKRQTMALLMWQHGEEGLAKALIGSKLLKALAHEAADDDLETEVYEELRRYGREFETLALDVLDYCYRQDEDMVYQLLTYELKNWSKETCLSLAVTVNHRSLLSHPCCQLLLADLWLGGLRTRKNTNIKVILGLLFPPLVSILGFRTKEELRSMPQTWAEHWDEEYSTSGSDSDNESNLDNENAEDISLVPPTVVKIEEDTTHSPKVSHSTLSHGPPLEQVNSKPKSPSTRWSYGSNSFMEKSFVTVHEAGSSYHHVTGIDITATNLSKELTIKTKFYEFYNAPITKFWSHSIAYVFFLCLFTYTVLVRLPDWPQWMEWYVVAYIFTFLVEKMREIISSEPVELRQKLEVWSQKLWNVFDLIFTIVFIIGFILRIQDTSTKKVGRVIYCVDVVYWHLKVLEILSAHKYLGPLVMMMGKMVKNMAYFVILLLVVLMAFGVCRQSILYPNEEPHWSLARNIFFQPYFMLYGEVFAGDIDPPCGGPGEIECQPGRWITPTIMALYLLIANILLINLLIAVFNNIFTSVNAISRQVWMFQRFRVVMEFEEKPVFPPPLIIISHIHRACKYLRRRYKGKPALYDHGLKRFLGGENLERVHDFEEECVDAYLREKDHKEQMSTEERVRIIAEKTESISQRQDDMKTKLANTLATMSFISSNNVHLHEELQQIKESYSVLHQFMSSQLGRMRKSSRSSSPASGLATTLSDSQASLYEMIESSSQRMLKEEDQYVKEPMSDHSDKEQSEVEPDTVQGKYGPLSVPMKIGTCVKRRKKELETRIKNKRSVHTESDSRPIEKTTVRRRKLSRKSSLKGDKVSDGHAHSPSKVSFKPPNRDLPEIESDSDDSLFNNRVIFRRSLSEHPRKAEERNIPYERSSSSSTSRPIIQVIPPSSPPHMLHLAGEYTSLGDQLESVCMTRTIQSRFLSPDNRGVGNRPRYFSESSSLRGHSFKHLKDAEELDYYLMEDLIKRRMDRDSENLAVSLEDLCAMSETAIIKEEIEVAQTEFGQSVNLRRTQSFSNVNRGRPKFLSVNAPMHSSTPRFLARSQDNLSYRRARDCCSHEVEINKSTRPFQNTLSIPSLYRRDSTKIEMDPPDNVHTQLQVPSQLLSEARSNVSSTFETKI